MIHLVAWTGGWEPPQYKVCKTDVEALTVAEDWASDQDEDSSETIEVLRIDGDQIDILWSY